MIEDSQGSDAALDRNYRQASATEAGRPAAATRAAILAEAQRLARRRVVRHPGGRPWALAAGVAMLGIAVLLWRQVQQQAPQVAALQPAPADLAPLPSPRLESQQALRPEPRLGAKAQADAPATPAVAAAPVPPAVPASSTVTPALRSAAEVAPAETASPESSAATVSLAAAPPVVVPAAPADAAPGASVAGKATAKDLAPRGLQLARAAGITAGPAAAPAAGSALRDATALLRQHFPAEYGADAPPRTLWLLRAADGTVLRSGGLGAAATLPEVHAALEREYPDRTITPWRITPAANGRGASIDLATATLGDPAPGDPAPGN